MVVIYHLDAEYRALTTIVKTENDAGHGGREKCRSAHHFAKQLAPREISESG